MLDTDLVSELYSIRQALRSLGEQLENKDQGGEAYTALLISESIQRIAEKMDNEDWRGKERHPPDVQTIN